MTGKLNTSNAIIGKALARYFSTLVAGMNSVGTGWIFALMVLVNADVLSRFIFNFPIQGVAEVVELSIVGIVFLQISDAVRAGRLTRSDGLYKRILERRPKLGHFLGAVFDLSGVFFFVAILLILVVGCLVVALQFFVLAWRHVVALRTDGSLRE